MPGAEEPTVTQSSGCQWFRDVALHAAVQGFYVFPLWPGSKVPATHHESRCPRDNACRHGHRTWEDRATRDPALIEHWWRSAALNVGIAAGRSGLHVLDLDAAHDRPAPARWAGCRDGRDVLARVADKAGAPNPWDTRTVRTPTGGLHLYFRAPAEVRLRNTVGRIGWRVDSRGEGGFVVAAGSRRPQGCYEVTHDAPIAPLPPWLIPLLQRPTLRPWLAPRQTGPRGTPTVTETRRQAYLAAVETSIGATETGSRHDALLRAAYTLGRLVAGGDFTDEQVRACLRDAASRWPGSPTAKDLHTIHDGLIAGMRHPRRLAG